MPPTELPSDQAARDRIANDLGTTLFVEAGAGTGKTTALVDRIVNHVLAGVPVRRIAAITFTKAAAGELKDRVRTELEKRAAAPGQPSLEAQRCQVALDELDGAAMQDLHAFAQRILNLFPLEAGLPPQVTVSDEIWADIEFNEDWARLMDRLLAGDDASIGRAFTLGLEVKHLRSIARAFGQNLDRLAGATFATRPFVLEREEILDQLATADDEVVSRGLESAGGPLVAHILSLRPLREALRNAVDDDEFLSLLTASRQLKATDKSEDNPIWHPLKKKDASGKRVANQALKDAEAARQEMLAGARSACLMPILGQLRDFTLDRAADRRRRGTLLFDDLLVLARGLLREHPEVRKAVANRFDRILIDEFQDTDPIQVEIATLLAASVDDVEGLLWHETPVHEGRLFFVGDPKQSIYRFRRADILLYQQAKEHFGGELSLTANFRSRAPILDWVNSIIGELVGPEAQPGQPAYQPLTGGRPHDDTAGPAVHLVGGPMGDKAVADEVRAVEATELVALIRSIPGQWDVDGETSGTRKARLSDIAVLLPTRSTFQAIERELESHNIPFRLESRSLLYQTQEVIDLTNLLAAIDDPADDVSIVAALRSPAFGCADDELCEYAAAGGHWDYTRAVPTVAPGHAVPAALGVLKDFHYSRWWLTVSGNVERVIRERKLMESALENRRPRETWQRLRFVQEQARAFDQAGGATLRQFVSWLRTQADEGSRVSESIVPESDDDAVRVMTVHAAKGLEFRIVILAGLDRDKSNFSDAALWRQDSDTPEVRVGVKGSYFQTQGFDAVLVTETEMGRMEDIRLYYVAATRARDHLIVSLHHKAKSSSHAAQTYAICRRLGLPFAEVPAMPTVQEPTRADEAYGSAALEERRTWLEARQALIDVNTRARTVAATIIARGIATQAWEPAPKPEQTDEAQPWRRGRAGTSIGRTVHAVLQTIDLDSGEGLEAAARAQATAEGIPGRESEIIELVRVALRSNAVREAVASDRLWREVFVAVNVDGVVVEGFIDLLYETTGGLVIVDYKTDSARNAADVDGSMEHYTAQGAAYALALQEAMPGRVVAKCVFVFVRPDMERAVDDLAGAISKVRAALPTVAAAP